MIDAHFNHTLKRFRWQKKLHTKTTATTANPINSICLTWGKSVNGIKIMKRNQQYFFKKFISTQSSIVVYWVWADVIVIKTWRMQMRTWKTKISGKKNRKNIFRRLIRLSMKFKWEEAIIFFLNCGWLVNCWNFWFFPNWIYNNIWRMCTFKRDIWIVFHNFVWTNLNLRKTNLKRSKGSK